MVRWTNFKRQLIGRPLKSDELATELLPKTLALPVFASDPLSSVAYASEESMLVLALAGATAFDLLTPISLVIATVLALVVVSYRQTIRAYPGGGGAFIVARENLGLGPGMVAASSLLTDYVLTVAVSVVAGVAAITSAVPALLPYRVLISIGFVLILTTVNLRGARESSLLFALPTYLFVATVFAMLIAGFGECLDGECPRAISADATLEAEVGALTLFLILRAFASGSTALTGVEAISNGVQAFREPKARNAGNTLLIMAAMSITMFLGISTLARLFEVKISEETVDTYGTVISQIGRAAFNGGVGFYLLQVFTAGILILAANTAYQDFPRLSAILARHRLMPRQFRNRGDRLVFSNGVFVLALLAMLLIAAFQAQLSRLIQLYVVGVFIGFTLSQSGMVKHWLKTRERGWRRSVAINLIGAIATGVVLVVIAAVKFRHGAWIVLVFIPLLVLWMGLIRRHYVSVADQLRRLPEEPPYPSTNRVLVLASHPGGATARAIAYAEMIAPAAITAVHVREPEDEDLLDTWASLFPDHPLIVVEAKRGHTFRSLRDHIRTERRAHPDSFLTVVIPELIRRRRLVSLLFHPHGLILKLLLLWEPGVVVTDMTVQRRRPLAGGEPSFDSQEAVVLVSDVTRPTRQALAYARLLGGAHVRAIHLNVDDEQRDRVLGDWDLALGPIEIVESPYRGITRPLLRYLRQLKRQLDSGTVVNVVIPEFVVPGWAAQFLHNQTAFAIKAILIFEPRVVVTSVPWHLREARQPAQVEPEIALPAAAPSEPVLRAATEADLGAIHQVWYAADWGDQPNRPALRTLPWYSHLIETGRVVVADRDGEVIGFAGVVDQGDRAVLADLFVLPEAQSQGLGGILLEAAMPNGLARLTLASADRRTVPLYTRKGMIPRWPNLYLRGRRDRMHEFPDQHFEVEPVAADDPRLFAVEQAAGAVHRSEDRAWFKEDLAAHFLLVLRAGEPVGAAVVSPTTPNSLRSPESAAVLCTAAVDPAAALGTVIAAVRSGLDTGAPAVWLTVPGPHSALPVLLEAGMRVFDTDIFCSSRPDLVNPELLTVNPDLL